MEVDIIRFMDMLVVRHASASITAVGYKSAYRHMVCCVVGWVTDPHCCGLQQRIPEHGVGDKCTEPELSLVLS